MAAQQYYGQPPPAYAPNQPNQGQYGMPPQQPPGGFPGMQQIMPSPNLNNEMVPPGLEQLLPLGQIFVKQQIDVMESYEQANRYMLFGPNGQMIYMAEEESECCQRQQCGALRSFVMHIRDPNGNGILLEKHYHFMLASMQVIAAATSELLGTIEQQCVCCKGAKFHVLDGFGNHIFVIQAPFCTEACCGGNIDFQILSPTDETIQVGQITKTWAGFGQEMFTSADNFGISFPIDLSVKMKAVLIGACILIDFAFYENQHRGNNNNHYF